MMKYFLDYYYWRNILLHNNKKQAIALRVHIDDQHLRALFASAAAVFTVDVVLPTPPSGWPRRYDESVEALGNRFS